MRRSLSTATASNAARWPGSSGGGSQLGDHEVAGGKAVEVVRIKITTAGRKAIEKLGESE
jgi:hypothetical protein